jgi:uncharacterized alpha-E superfamily protein
MLSRIAESLYWIGRYNERADATSRVLDVHLQRDQDDLGTELGYRGLLAAMGVDPPERHLSSADVVDMLGYDSDSPSSITTALEAVRENARGAREII